MLKLKPLKRNKFEIIASFIKPSEQIEMLVNDTTGLQIVGIKHRVKNGQILILDLSVYK